jgi:ATP-dependent exoDNAse (exonuclease V) beta subunit
MAGANQEQLKAIQHSGGVLLKAGAGSGKTFVLKEHMIYLSKKWMSEFKESNSVESFSDVIKSKFSKVVLMTFTKKAAGEISIRLHDEFEETLEVMGEDRNLWEIVCENLDYLTITTIHGYCFKLIKQGFFPEVDIDNEMLSDTEFNNLIESIFASWIQNFHSSEADDFLELVLKDKDFVLSSLKSILSDPTLRSMWKKLNLESISLASTDTSIQGLVKVFKLNECFESASLLHQYPEYKGKKWYDFLESFFSAQSSINTFQDVLDLNQYFCNLKYKIPTSPRSNSTEAEIHGLFQSVKSLNAFLKSNGEDLMLYNDNFDTFVLSWFKSFKDLVDYANIEYDKAPGITFSDLEFIVRSGLEDNAIAAKIAESYEYLVVDEFQDTSYIQFEIIQKIIQGDFNKLFCVGDIKQAIYGFRGGELGVFLDCQEMTNQVLSLKNNYRSDKDIVSFNNNFFDFLFLKGLKFEGEDVKPVEVEYQENPIEDRELGEIFEITANIDFLAEHGISKVGNSEIEYLEALLLIRKIEELKVENESVCILYKKLKPSLLLIGLMIEKDLGFTAQIKIPFAEDPICSLFKLLIEHEFNLSEQKNYYIKLIVRAYLCLLDSELIVDVDRTINTFEEDRRYFGLYQAFFNFLSNCNIANSNFKNNLIQIKDMCKIANEDPEHLVSLLEDSKGIAYSLDFQYGKESNAITIMTAHASKGLQFSNVLLGGIYTNDKSFPFTGLFGKYPLSMKWSREVTSKTKYKTPQYILESEETKLKEFSESKRLFYVACTRAVNSLGWVDIDFGKVKKRTNSNSWHNGISVWKSEVFKTNQEIIKDVSKYEFKIQDDFSLSFLSQSSNKKPLFHIDTLGTTSKIEQGSYMILPELSVTRLATVVDCPRKFYFSNICKITEEDLALLGGDLSRRLYTEEDDLSSKSFTSSAKRGTNLHYQLERTIKNGLILPEDIDSKDRDAILWTVDKLKEFPDNSKFISEESTKFEFFNYMISGIPDLIILNPDGEKPPEIWDYKTGSIKESTSEIYHFQLVCYAYALYLKEDIPANESIKVVLCYIDEEKMIEKMYTKEDVENYLKPFWSDLTNPDKINPSHCESCPYGNICHK